MPPLQAYVTHCTEPVVHCVCLSLLLDLTTGGQGPQFIHLRVWSIALSMVSVEAAYTNTGLKNTQSLWFTFSHNINKDPSSEERSGLPQPQQKRRKRNLLRRQTKPRLLSPYPSCHLSARAGPRTEALVFWHPLSSLSNELNSLFPFILARTRSSADPSSLEQAFWSASILFSITALPLENSLKAGCTQTQVIIFKPFAPY